MKKSTEMKKGHKKENILKKLKPLFDNIPNLPIQPSEVHFVGSFLRDKEIISDVDILPKFDAETEARFEKFKRYFPLNAHGLWTLADRRVSELYELMDKYYQSLISEGLKLTFQEFCERTPSLKDLIETKFGLEFDLFRYCSWSEARGTAPYTVAYLPLHQYFRRLFCRNRKGIEFHRESNLAEGYNSVCLWSPERPDFEANFQAFLRDEANAYIRKEYPFLIGQIDGWITHYQQEGHGNRVYQEAIARLQALKTEFLPELLAGETYASLSEKCNRLRKEMKHINLWIEENKK